MWPCVHGLSFPFPFGNVLILHLLAMNTEEGVAGTHRHTLHVFSGKFHTQHCYF